MAWIDGEMCHADAQKFEEELRRDERLSGRTAELMKSNADYPGAFAAMLDDAPLEKMQARLAELPDPKPATPAGVSPARTHCRVGQFPGGRFRRGIWVATRFRTF